MGYGKKRGNNYLRKEYQLMTNVFFPDEKVSSDDLYFVCYMSENPLAVEAEWIEDYGLVEGNYDVSKVDTELCQQIPTATQMGKVYKRLVLNTMQTGEDYADAILRVYNNPICEVLDNYNCSAYYEPSPYIARSYFAGGF